MEPGHREKPVASTRGGMLPTLSGKATSAARGDRGGRWSPGGMTASPAVETNTWCKRRFGGLTKNNSSVAQESLKVFPWAFQELLCFVFHYQHAHHYLLIKYCSGPRISLMVKKTNSKKSEATPTLPRTSLFSKYIPAFSSNIATKQKYLFKDDHVYY